MAGYSNYAGFPQGVTIKGVPLTVTNPGKVFWLSNATTLQTGDRGGSDGNKGTYNSPFATLNYAFTQCVANRGDTIVVKPGHAEIINATTLLCAASIAGVAVIGLGVGSNRPKWTISTANTATITVSAANISFTNCQFVGNFLSIATCFTLTTAKYFTLQSCTFADAGATTNFLNCITSTGAANTVDGLTISDCAWSGLGTTSVNSFILSANDIDGAVLQRNNVILARTATAAILATITAGVVTNFYAAQNNLYSKQTVETGGSIINVGGSTSTGILDNNKVADLAAASDITYTVTSGLQGFNNTKTGALATQGFPVPVIDS